MCQSRSQANAGVRMNGPAEMCAAGCTAAKVMTPWRARFPAARAARKPAPGGAAIAARAVRRRRICRHAGPRTVPESCAHKTTLANRLRDCCTISRNGPARFRVNGPTLHGLPAEPRLGEFYRSFFFEASFLALTPRYVSPVIVMMSAECSSRSRMASKITVSGMTSFQ
jgi:hypothetical protein